MIKHTIKILPHGRKLFVENGRRLLTSLMEHSIFLRSDCGGKGVCGKCRVEVSENQGKPERTTACTVKISKDIKVTIPETSMLTAHIAKKAPAILPQSFYAPRTKIPANKRPAYGLAVDLGTTTIALYLCDISSGDVLISMSLKNPQVLYGDDVMSRIGAIVSNPDNLPHQQKIVVGSIEWGCRKLAKKKNVLLSDLEKMVVVGNPAMVQLFLGIDSGKIGVAPYLPAFYAPKTLSGLGLGFEALDVKVFTFPQMSGFLGGDILSAALAAELHKQPPETMIMDIGTNGELVYKGRSGIFATSCATGPAFEGASICCGMQAIPGAIEKVMLPNRFDKPGYVVIKENNGNSVPEPIGVCGSGVLSAVAELCRKSLINKGGTFVADCNAIAFCDDPKTGKRFTIAEKSNPDKGTDVFISQKDIRAVQLGKAALRTGIEFLLEADGGSFPRKIIVAGAFGSYLQRKDILTLGMIPKISFDKIEYAGNLAGAGAIMALCSEKYFQKINDFAVRIKVVDLASHPKFQDMFIRNLQFSEVKDPPLE